MTSLRMKQRAAKTAIDSIDEIASIRIELVGSEPLIWRQVEVPTSITLKGLHDIVQAVMGWFDYHLCSSPLISDATACPVTTGGTQTRQQMRARCVSAIS